MVTFIEITSVRDKVNRLILIYCAVLLVLCSTFALYLLITLQPDGRLSEKLLKLHLAVREEIAAAGKLTVDRNELSDHIQAKGVRDALVEIRSGTITPVLAKELDMLEYNLIEYERSAGGAISGSELEQSVNRMEAIIMQAHDLDRLNALVFFICGISGIGGICYLSARIITRRFQEPVSELAVQMAQVIQRKHTPVLRFGEGIRRDEMDAVITLFNMLNEKSKNQFELLKHKSELLRKKNKDLKKLNRELDHFLYCTAHDLRSPLTSLLGLLNIIRYENSQDALKPYFVMMEKSVKSMEGFIRQIGDYTGNKHVGPDFRRIELNELITEVLDNHRFAEKSVMIRKDVIINDAAVCVSDYNRLYIILNNLISNSIKYADLEKATPWLQVKVDVAPSQIGIHFSDNGIGIRDEHLSHIFEMFYRADHNSKGSGLGLFILKESINSLGGNLFVKSEPGIGTEFIITIPNHPGSGILAVKAG